MNEINNVRQSVPGVILKKRSPEGAWKVTHYLEGCLRPIAQPRDRVED